MLAAVAEREGAQNVEDKRAQRVLRLLRRELVGRPAPLDSGWEVPEFGRAGPK